VNRSATIVQLDRDWQEKSIGLAGSACASRLLSASLRAQAGREVRHGVTEVNGTPIEPTPRFGVQLWQPQFEEGGMAQQRLNFDVSKLKMADRILAVAGLLFFIDSFLPWQRECAGVAGFSFCGSASGWNGNGSWAGVLAGLCAIALIASVALQVFGVDLGPSVPLPTIGAVAAAGTVLFTLLKFLLIVGNSIFVFGFIGLALALAIGYGGYLKWRERPAA
jgi:hypothetical protein